MFERNTDICTDEMIECPGFVSKSSGEEKGGKEETRVATGWLTAEGTDDGLEVC